jgi:predicted nucleic acid-binding protein
VVSDAGPLIHLSQINKLHLIKNLFKTILITPNVKREAFDEGIRLGHADAEIIGKALEDWICMKSISKQSARTAEKLAVGENISFADAETLLLAESEKAELLVDDKVVADLAKMYRLKVWNTWTILLESLNEGLIAMKDITYAMDELGKRRHKLGQKQVAEILKTAETIATKKKMKQP